MVQGRYSRELASVQNSLSVRPLVMRKWGEAATEGEAVVLVVVETVAAAFVEPHPAMSIAAAAITNTRLATS